MANYGVVKGLTMPKWEEKKNVSNDYTYILFDGVLSGRYKINAWCFSAKPGDSVTYKAQQIDDHIWLSVIIRYSPPALLKRIPCGAERLTNDEIYQIAIEHI